MLEQYKRLLDSKEFKSSTIGFSVAVPKGYEINEKLTYVELILNGEKIIISKSSTELKDAISYVADFDGKREELTVDEQKQITVNSLPGIVRVEKFTVGPIGQQKVYYIYADGDVITLSTSTKSLYSDLDQIAQSFQYTPN